MKNNSLLSPSFASCKLARLIIAVSVAVMALVPAASAAEAFVRLNQMGYEAGAPMRAYLMTTGSVAGAKFTIKSAEGKPVRSGDAGQSLGTWGNYTVYPLDFAIADSGAYTVAVTGPVVATSLVFKVDRPANLYSGALANALEFYQNQRDGAAYIRSALRTAPAHLNDAKAKVYHAPKFAGRDHIDGDLAPTGAVIDASGGWLDAGDYVKFVETTSYTTAVMLIGVRDFPQQMGAGSSKSNFLNEAKFGLDWLKKMWDDKSQTLYYQVGIGSGGRGFEDDHSIWRLPQVDDTYGGSDPKFRYIRNRPVFVAGAAGSKISPNLAGRLAADFALCYRVYRASDPAYANQCLLAAEHVFDLADTSPSGELLTTAPHGFYDESEWRDDMELGATELFFAVRNGPLPTGLSHTDPMFYLKAATTWAAAYMKSDTRSSGFSVYDVGGLAHFELCRALALAGNPSGLAVSRSDLINDLKRSVDHAVKVAGKDPFDFGYPWRQGDTPSHGAALAVMAMEYDFLNPTKAYADHSNRWMANILGANAWGTSFIVGDGSLFPHCIHHQIANLIGSKDGRLPMLAGALVEGPNRRAVSGATPGMAACPSDGVNPFAKFDGNGAVYKDNSESYDTAEPAIDLTAPSFLLFAWKIAGAPSGQP